MRVGGLGGRLLGRATNTVGTDISDMARKELERLKLHSIRIMLINDE